jgi:nitroimidazol reductase NimA-like FMN-containing flavoprotein (pyridoxamine 5'-phosphate oxidase superfamily)
MDIQPVTALSDDDSWNLISAVHLGRLVTVVEGRPEIFPVNFVVQRRTVLFRTAEGTKLFTAVMNDQVLFEADDHNLVDGWSVIVRGTANVLFAADDIQDADQAGLYPWIATQKLRYVRVTPKEITGRKFVFGPEPESGSVPG